MSCAKPRKFSKDRSIGGTGAHKCISLYYFYAYVLFLALSRLTPNVKSHDLKDVFHVAMVDHRRVAHHAG